MAACAPAILLALCSAVGPDAAGEPLRLQTVLPPFPGKNNVRWWEFDWKWAELSPMRGAAPVRLYFYQSERPVARTAAAFIADAYTDLARAFAYKPRATVPFLLYNSHFEFESTQAFLVSEQVLGVTSTEDLTMALPFWGDHQRFRYVMRHELAHQFTIQMLLDAAPEGCAPVALLPLWFVEGIAQYFAEGDLSPRTRGRLIGRMAPTLSPEVRSALADRLLHRDEHGGERGVPGFFDEGPGTFERVYLVGHAEALFLEQSYGPGTIRRILAAAPRLCADAAGSFLGVTPFAPPREAFSGLVAEVTGAKPAALDQRWKAWAREQVAPAFTARQPLGSLEVIEGTGPGEIDSFSLSPDGQVIFWRSLDLDTGVSRLYLAPLEDLGARKLITEDERLGLISVHPLDRRVTALGPDRLVWIGRTGPADTVFVRHFSLAREHGRPRIALGKSTRHRVDRFYALIEAGWPAVDPVTGAVSFVGLSRVTGQLDIYRIDQPEGGDAALVAVTQDPWAEQGLVVLADGSMVLASDATADGRWELARLGSGPRPLTDFPPDFGPRSPAPDGAGGIVFEAGATGFVQAYRLAHGAVTRISDVPTELTSPAVDAGGNLLGLVRIDGARRLVRIRRAQLLAEPAPGGPSRGAGPVWQPPQAELGEVHDYDPKYRLRLGAAAAGTGAVGALALSWADLFQERLFGVAALILGDFHSANAQVFYLDRSGRDALGATVFVESGLQLEPDFRLTDATYLLQRFGARFLFVHPFGRYTRAEAYAGPQGLRAFDFDLPNDAFARANQGTSFALEAGARLALDTVRRSAVGPVDGMALVLDLSGTFPVSGAQIFANTTLDFVIHRSLVRGYERVSAHGRLALGTGFGGDLVEQFYLPSSYNLRAIPGGSDAQVGNDYGLAQLELHFPVAPVIARRFFLQGVLGGDFGAIGLSDENLWDQRLADAVGGLELDFYGLSLAFFLARAFDLGGAVPEEDWLTFFRINVLFL